MVQGTNTCKNVRTLIEKYIEAMDIVPSGSEIRLQFGYATGFEKKSIEESKTLLRFFLKGLKELPDDAPMSLTLNVGQYDSIVNVLQQEVEAKYQSTLPPVSDAPVVGAPSVKSQDKASGGA